MRRNPDPVGGNPANRRYKSSDEGYILKTPLRVNIRKRKSMADFNISANFNVNPPSRNFQTAPASITFSAAQACRVTFTPASGNCFGISYLDLAGGPDTISQPVTSSTDTQGTAAAQPMAAAAGVGGGVAAAKLGDNNPDTLSITFDSEPK